MTSNDRPFLAKNILTYVDCPSGRLAAELLGVSASAVTRWGRGGRLSDVEADEWATKLGVHPSEIWPDYWDVAATVAL